MRFSTMQWHDTRPLVMVRVWTASCSSLPGRVSPLTSPPWVTTPASPGASRSTSWQPTGHTASVNAKDWERDLDIAGIFLLSTPAVVECTAAPVCWPASPATEPTRSPTWCSPVCPSRPSGRRSPWSSPAVQTPSRYHVDWRKFAEREVGRAKAARTVFTEEIFFDEFLVTTGASLEVGGQTYNKLCSGSLCCLVRLTSGAEAVKVGVFRGLHTVAGSYFMEVCLVTNIPPSSRLKISVAGREYLITLRIFSKAIMLKIKKNCNLLTYWVVSLTLRTHVDPVEISGSFRNLQLGWRLPSGRDLQTDQSGPGRPVQCGRPPQLHRHRRHHRQEIRPRLTTVSVNVLHHFYRERQLYLFVWIYLFKARWRSASQNCFPHCNWNMLNCWL